jgi:hypothetical protein
MKGEYVAISWGDGLAALLAVGIMTFLLLV